MHYTFLLAGIDNGMMEKKFFLYIAVIISTFSMQTVAGGIDHTVNLKNWKKVILIYFRDFPYQQRWSVQPPFKCFFSLSAGSVIQPVWRCRERIGLLRPATLVNHWKQEQNSKGVFYFSLPGSGIYHVAAHIESVSSVTTDMAVRLSKSVSDAINTDIVTGVFLRHSMDVRTYTFQSLTTGRLNKINATPEHPFYVTNLHTWMPLYKITPSMLLTDNHNNPVMLRCPGHQQYHCGVPLYPRKIRAVYNLEVYKKHAYHVGGLFLLAHNYGLALKSTGHFGSVDTLESMLIRKLAEPILKDSCQKIIKDILESQAFYLNEKQAATTFFKKLSSAVSKHNTRMESYGLLPYRLAPPPLYFSDATPPECSNITRLRFESIEENLGTIAIIYNINRTEHTLYMEADDAYVKLFGLGICGAMEDFSWHFFYYSRSIQPGLSPGNVGQLVTGLRNEKIVQQLK